MLLSPCTEVKQQLVAHWSHDWKPAPDPVFLGSVARKEGSVGEGGVGDVVVVTLRGMRSVTHLGIKATTTCWEPSKAATNFAPGHVPAGEMA